MTKKAARKAIRDTTEGSSQSHAAETFDQLDCLTSCQLHMLSYFETSEKKMVYCGNASSILDF